MDLTETHGALLADAYLLAREGKGMVLKHEAYPDAVELEDAGWLERRYVDATGDWSWFWTQQAEGALDTNALMQSAEGREN